MFFVRISRQLRSPKGLKGEKKEGEPQLKLTSIKMSVRGIILIKQRV